MGVFERGVEAMLRRAGTECEVTLNGKCVHFYGTLDTETAMEVDNSGNQVPVRVTVLRTLTSIAEDLTTAHTITIGTKKYRVRDVLLVDDGTLSEVYLARSN